jgi:hypothetical protein
VVEHLFIIQKEDRNMFQQATSCSCDVGNSQRDEGVLSVKKNQGTPKLVEIVNAMLTAILIKNTGKLGQKDDDLQCIINEISVITQNLR